MSDIPDYDWHGECYSECPICDQTFYICQCHTNGTASTHGDNETVPAKNEDE